MKKQRNSAEISSGNRNLKKVLFFTNGLVALGGAERVVLEGALYFKKKCINKGSIATKIVTFVLNDDALQNYKGKLIISCLSSSSYLGRVSKLRSFIKEFDPVIIIGQSSLDCMYLYLATLFTKYSYISYIHGSLFWLENDHLKYSLIHRRVFERIRSSVYGHMQFVPVSSGLSFRKKVFFNIVSLFEYLGVRKAKQIIVLTKQISWEVKLLYNRKPLIIRGCLDKRLLNYKPKINIKALHSLRGKRVILSIGRLDSRKRINVLLMAFYKICKLNKDVFLLIGGKGPDMERLKAIAGQSKYSRFHSRVIFLGFVPDEQYFDYISGCDVYAFPSWTTSGIPPHEALALGKKVVWSSEAEEPVLSHPNVYLSKPLINEFAAALDKALNSKTYPKPNLKDNTWELYFEKLYSAASLSANNHP